MQARPGTLGRQLANADAPPGRRYHQSRIRRWATYIVLYGVGLVMVVPFLWTFSSSLKPLWEIFAFPPTIIPQEPSLDNYFQAFRQAPIAQWFINSGLVAGGVVFLNLVFASMAGYAFARLQFPGKNVLFIILLSTLMIPFHITLVPLFLILRNLGLINNLWGVIFPSAATIFGVFLLKQFFEQIPYEIEEAAIIDGASELQIYGRIILPLAKPALATLAIVVFLQTWGEFLLPLLVLHTREMYTVPLGLATFQQEAIAHWGQTMAVTFLADLPVLLLFLLLQRFIVTGLTAGALKG